MDGGRTPRAQPARRARGRVLAFGLLIAAGLLASGCGLFGVDLGVDGLKTDWVSVDTQNDRQALVAWPESHSNTVPTDKVPLVIVMHGLGGDAEQMARLAEWPQAARDHNFVVAFPDGVESSWNAGGCCGVAAAEGTNDIAYLDALIDQMVAEKGVDPSQVFMTGYSNGAMMTYRYLCERPDRLAGAASVSGTDWSGCEQSAAVPFLQVSGDKDPVVPVKGGPSTMPGVGDVPKVETSVAALASEAGCSRPTTTELGQVKVTLAENCRNGATVRFDVVDGLDHSYPTAAVTPQYVAVDRILDFWGLGSRPAAPDRPAGTP